MNICQLFCAGVMAGGSCIRDSECSDNMVCDNFSDSPFCRCVLGFEANDFGSCGRFV